MQKQTKKGKRKIEEKSEGEEKAQGQWDHNVRMEIKKSYPAVFHSSTS